MDYFPSYEIITGNFSRGAYYENDLREVNSRGVAHAMRIFLEHYPSVAANPKREPERAAEPRVAPSPMADGPDANEIVCDEEVIERARRGY